MDKQKVEEAFEIAHKLAQRTDAGNYHVVFNAVFHALLIKPYDVDNRTATAAAAEEASTE